MPLILRSVKGSNLTADEVDGNFEYVDGRVDDAIALIEAPVGIANIVQNGATAIIVLDDSTEHPITLPVASPRPSTTFPVSGTTFTPGLSQSDFYFRCTNAGGCLVTIPDFADVAIPIDSQHHYVQCGTSPISFTEGSTDVILNFRDGYEQYTDGRFSVVTAKKVAQNEWDIFGALAETVTV
jgi:hypothetical protein